MAVEVGSGYVSLFPSVRGFAQKLKKAIADEVGGANLDKAIADSVSQRPVRVPVNVDPLLREFQSQVQREVSALSREVNAHIPVTAETAGLRSDLAAEIGRLEQELRAEIPTEPAGRREYEAKLHALVDSAQRRVKASIKVEPDVDRNRFRTALMSGVAAALGQVSGAASTITGVVSNATSSLVGMASSLLAVGAAVTFAVPGVYLVGGAIGSLPAIVSGAVAALGALSLGMMGIADHFKDVGGSGGGAGQNLAAQARQVAQATRGVESAQRSLARAQREVVAAQQAVTRAREAEVERLQDLNRSAKHAALDEERAIERVKEAKQALDDAKATGREDDIKKARLEYDEAVLGLEDAKDATQDLAAEQAKAAKVGVEGSDQVQEALQRQRDAVEGVTAANEQLLSAQEALQAANEKPASGGGGAAQELLKLAPAAQKFVDTIKSLKPAFEQLRLGVQQKLFAGLDKSVRQLATAWFPQLNKTLGDYATTFNGLAKKAADSLSKKSFIDNIAAGAESARWALERIGDAVSGPLVDAFGRLSKAAGPFVKVLGAEVARLIEDFSTWIEKLDKNGGLDSFFERASQVLSDVFDMGRDLASIFGSVMEILFNDGDQTVTASPWEMLKNTLNDLAIWFKDPENQQKVRDFFDKVEKFLTEDLPNAIRTAKEAIDTVDGWVKKVQEWRDKIEAFRLKVVTAFQAIGGALRAIGSPISLVLGQFGRLRTGAITQASALTSWMRGLPGRILSALGNTGNLLYQAGRNVVQGLIDGIRARFPDLGNAIGTAAGLIRAYLPFSPAKMGPLSGAGNPYNSGKSIVRLLSAGITDTLGSARSAASDLAGTFALSGSPVSGMSLPAGGATPAPGHLVAEWVGGDGDPIMRAIREHTRIYYGGSPQAAFAS